MLNRCEVSEYDVPNFLGSQEWAIFGCTKKNVFTRTVCPFIGWFEKYEKAKVLEYIGLLTLMIYFHCTELSSPCRNEYSKV